MKSTKNICAEEGGGQKLDGLVGDAEKRRKERERKKVTGYVRKKED